MLRFFMIVSIISILSIALIRKDEFLSFYAQHNSLSTNIKATEGRDYVNTDNYANRQINFYYYIPIKVQQNKKQINPILILVPGLSGNGEAFTTQQFKDFADKEGFILLSPSFNYDNKYSEIDKGTSYQYPAVWSGITLLQMVQKIRDLGYTVSKFYLFGFSAGAQYCLRFTLWHPEFCMASATHANGGYPIIPTQANSIKYYITVGNQDERYRQENALKFYNTAKQLGINACFKEYSVGHSLPDEQIVDSLNFFKQVQNNQTLVIPK